VAGSREDYNEHSGSLKGEKILEYMNYYKLLSKDFALLS
jgi:hypothetical protein